MGFQFTIKRMFLAVTVIAAGIGMLSVPMLTRPDWFVGPITGVVIVISATIIGAGIGLIFKRPLWGALVGFCIGIAAVIFGQEARD
jgi:hypothetical protein